jgi:hypothetical protein
MSVIASALHQLRCSWFSSWTTMVSLTGWDAATILLASTPVARTAGSDAFTGTGASSDEAFTRL